MTIGVIIPDRGDRPVFMAQCLKYMDRQTRKPDYIEVVNDAPLSSDKDITMRYRLGYERLSNKGCDLIFFIENDDWYREDYIEGMILPWERYDRPIMFGMNYTIYYHIKTNRYVNLSHPGRSSAMNMFLVGGKQFDFGNDNSAFTDIALWNNHKGVSVHGCQKSSLGIKHGIGLSGGIAHNPNWKGYDKSDPDGSYLKSIIGEEDFNFYNSLYL